MALIGECFLKKVGWEGSRRGELLPPPPKAALGQLLKFSAVEKAGGSTQSSSNGSVSFAEDSGGKTSLRTPEYMKRWRGRRTYPQIEQLREGKYTKKHNFYFGRARLAKSLILFILCWGI